MQTAVRMVNISKSFAGNEVLSDISLELMAGEVHGLIGENGSGKSTLVKILSGVHEPDPGGDLTFWGEPASFSGRPMERSVATIHQDQALADDMTVGENVGITAGYGTRALGLYRRRAEEAAVRTVAKEFGVRIDPRAKVSSLDPAEKSIVAILRALRLLRDSGSAGHIVILDEPTAALKATEARRLLRAVRALAASGACVLFISHRLNEVLDVCDRVTVLRSGKLVATVEADATTDDQLVTLMLGYELGAFYPDREVAASEEVRLKVTSLAGHGVTDVSFEVNRGEIVGVTGLTGMGQDEIPYLVYGAHARSGDVLCDGLPFRATVAGALEAGVALVPGNRIRDALWSLGSAMENLTIPHLNDFRSGGRMRRSRESRFADEVMSTFDVRPRQPDKTVAMFSGGNQQKIVLARWLELRPKVLLLHEPTQGVDAGARKELFRFIRRAAEQGTAILLCSSDIEEVANVCDRVLVMRDGELAAELSHERLSVDRLIAVSQGASMPTREEAR